MSYMMQRILSAAIKTATGQVVTLPAPARHLDIFRYMIDVLHLPSPGSVQGFVTDDGEFLGRRGARMVADLAGQVKPKAQRSPFLFTEDLW
jgi:hypothetical protein